jgi:hypothetical protein
MVSEHERRLARTREQMEEPRDRERRTGTFRRARRAGEVLEEDQQREGCDAERQVPEARDEERGRPDGCDRERRRLNRREPDGARRRGGSRE